MSSLLTIDARVVEEFNNECRAARSISSNLTADNIKAIQETESFSSRRVSCADGMHYLQVSNANPSECLKT